MLVVLQFSLQSGAAGATVTIVGAGFDTTADTTVNFNGTPAPSSVSATQIVVPVPSGASSGHATVTSPAGALTTTASFTVGAPAAPKIASVSEAMATAGDSVITSGSNFDPVLANNKVFFDGRFAIVMAASPTPITATVPLASSGPVSLETPNGRAVTASRRTLPVALAPQCGKLLWFGHARDFRHCYPGP